uniref:Uncharacterized protein n=1 Tax=Sphaerodactylus townsendi TaxID=933632 RepID=A0ACB8EFE0_9SAUR
MGKVLNKAPKEKTHLPSPQIQVLILLGRVERREQIHLIPPKSVFCIPMGHCSPSKQPITLKIIWHDGFIGRGFLIMVCTAICLFILQPCREDGPFWRASILRLSQDVFSHALSVLLDKTKKGFSNRDFFSHQINFDTAGN